ncbi:MAG TPA: glycosyltransferase family 39 protein [Planctomicrobium sp.]|nr:glycosyltransferase family 39 protein [Planctomicrobium sp.]
MSTIISSSAERRSTLFTGIVLLSLLTTLGIAAGVRLLRLGDLPYWFDESYSLRTAQFPLLEMISSCAQDTHPPFYYFTLKSWVACFGDSEWSARLLSTLWSLGAVGGAFGFTFEALRDQRDRPTGRAATLLAAILAGLCVALSPIQISWAQQVRMYAPVACLSILSTWLLWRAVQKPDRTGRWIAYALVEAAGLYTHVTMLFIFAAHLLAMGVILIQGRKNWSATKQLAWRAVIVMGFVGLIVLPWVLVVRSQHARVQDDFWIQPFTWKLLGGAFLQGFGGQQRVIRDPNLGLWIAQGLMLISLFVAAGRRSFDILVALTAVMPFVLLVAVSLASTNIVNGRYFVAGHALMCVAIPVWIARLPSWFLRIPLALLLTGTLIFLVQDYHTHRKPRAGQRGLQQMLATWQEHRNEGEPLVFCNPTYYITARIYHGPDDLKVFGEEQDYPFFNGTAVTSESEYLSSAAIDSGDWQTVWVCDTSTGGRNRPPVAMGEGWRLSTEAVMKDYSGTFCLKRYDRIE